MNEDVADQLMREFMLAAKRLNAGPTEVVSAIGALFALSLAGMPSDAIRRALCANLLEQACLHADCSDDPVTLQ